MRVKEKSNKNTSCTHNNSNQIYVCNGQRIFFMLFVILYKLFYQLCCNERIEINLALLFFNGNEHKGSEKNDFVPILFEIKMIRLPNQITSVIATLEIKVLKNNDR